MIEVLRQRIEAFETHMTNLMRIRKELMDISCVDAADSIREAIEYIDLRLITAWNLLKALEDKK